MKCEGSANASRTATEEASASIIEEGNSNQSSVKTEKEQKAAINIIPFRRQRSIEGTSEEYPIDLVQSSPV